MRERIGEGMKKYVCVGGYVISKNDGDKHYVSGKRLMQLYQLSPDVADCIEEDDEWAYWRQFNPDSAYGKPIKLSPRYDGNYAIQGVRDDRR